MAETVSPRWMREFWSLVERGELEGEDIFGEVWGGERWGFEMGLEDGEVWNWLWGEG